jgi:hypothetical protein
MAGRLQQEVQAGGCHSNTNAVEAAARPWQKTHFAAVKVSRDSSACEAFFSGDSPPKLLKAGGQAEQAGSRREQRQCVGEVPGWSRSRVERDSGQQAQGIGCGVGAVVSETSHTCRRAHTSCHPWRAHDGNACAALRWRVCWPGQEEAEKASCAGRWPTFFLVRALGDEGGSGWGWVDLIWVGRV